MFMLVLELSQFSVSQLYHLFGAALVQVVRPSPLLPPSPLLSIDSSLRSSSLAAYVVLLAAYVVAA